MSVFFCFLFLKFDEKSTAIRLNPNHSHFIFVDDGSFGEYGVDVDFRSNLEEYIRTHPQIFMKSGDQTKTNENIPMVLLVPPYNLHRPSRT